MKYRKKTAVVEAIMWDGENYNEIKNFLGTDCRRSVEVMLAFGRRCAEAMREECKRGCQAIADRDDIPTDQQIGAAYCVDAIRRVEVK